MSLPSKTFLIGEYAVLSGGPALLANTEPRFRMVFSAKGQSQVEGVHPSSPGGIWIRAHREDFVNVSAWFEDPHNLRGGFGASSAQFAFCYAWSKIKNSSLTGWAQGLNSHALYQEFKQQSASQGTSGSGADIVAQTTGGVTFFQPQPFTAEAWDWPFRDLAFCLLRTGRKVNTHAHLSEMKPSDFTNLVQLAVKGCDAFKRSHSDSFIKTISEYGEELQRLNLVEAHSQELLLSLTANRKVLAAKGCGALGADVLLVVSRTEDLESIRSLATQLSLTTVATDKELTEGFKLEVAIEPRFDVLRNQRDQQGLIDA